MCYFFMLGFIITMKWHWYRSFIMFAYIKPFKGKKAAEDWAHDTASIWGGEIATKMPLWKVDFIGDSSKYGNLGPVIYVANHESYTDILSMFISRLSYRWLSKAEIFRIPIVGFWMKHAGYLSLDRKNVKSAEDILNKSKDLIKDGNSIFIFPEGTRSKDGNVGRFKIGAFKISKELNAPVVPIVFIGSGSLMKAGSFIPRKGHLKIIYGEPIKYDEKETIEEYANRVRDKVIELKNANK